MTDPPPAKDLGQALAGMRFALEPGRFALLAFPEPPWPEDLDALGQPPGMLVREAGETTLFVRAEVVERVRARHPAARSEEGLAWIRFEQPMGWEVVGFLARVSERLAAAGVPIGVVCGFSRDHLFVSEQKLAPALEALRSLFPEAPSRAGG